VFHEDGVILDSMEADFEVAIPWEIFPLGITEDSLVTFTFEDEIPPEIDAIAQAGLRIIFSDTGAVSGKVLVARYVDVPQVAVDFSAPEGKGGAGCEAIYYVAIHIDGFTGGTAEINMVYTESQINGYDETSLFIAYWDGAKWQYLKDIRVFSGANYVSGKIPVSELVGAPVALGAVRLSSPEPTEEAGDDTASFAIWAGLAAAVILIIAILIILILRRRR
jgi:hypothetical protein